MPAWTISLILYAVLLISVHFLSRRSTLFNLLRLPKNTGWIAAGVVLFVTMYSTSSAGLISAIVTEKGPGDLLIVWAALIPLGFLPMVFAPLWAKLNFISENEFVTLRFAQPWATRLRTFRAFYVGGLVAPILLSFTLLAFVDVVITFSDMGKTQAIAIVTFLMMLNAWRTSFTSKVVMDVVHFVAFLLPLIAATYAVSRSNVMVRIDLSAQPLLPEPLALFAFLGVQWWSAQIVDGTGVEAQQLMGTGRRKAVLTAMLMSLLTVIVGSLILYLSIHSGGGQIQPGQQAYLAVIYANLPPILLPVMAIGMLGIFISTYEAVQLWGGGLILSGLNSERLENASPRMSRYIMFVLALVSGLIAWQADRLTVLLELLLGLTAGVGLVYIVRWFWWRVNAQTQIAAMLLPIVLMIMHKGLPHIFSNLAWMQELTYPLMMMLYTGISISVVAVLMWKTNGAADKAAFARFAEKIELRQRQVLPNIAKALLFGCGLLVLQLVIAYAML